MLTDITEVLVLEKQPRREKMMTSRIDRTKTTNWIYYLFNHEKITVNGKTKLCLNQLVYEKKVMRCRSLPYSSN